MGLWERRQMKWLKEEMLSQNEKKVSGEVFAHKIKKFSSEFQGWFA